MFSISTETLIFVGVFAHLALSLGKLVFKAPQQQALLTSIDAKVDGVVAYVRQALPVLQTVTPKSVSTPLSTIQTVEELSLALNALPSSNSSNSSNSSVAASGGAS
jgi:hypothetical protein